jgi:hypothetical protein
MELRMRVKVSTVVAAASMVCWTRLAVEATDLAFGTSAEAGAAMILGNAGRSLGT